MAHACTCTGREVGSGAPSGCGKSTRQFMKEGSFTHMMGPLQRASTKRRKTTRGKRGTGAPCDGNRAGGCRCSRLWRSWRRRRRSRWRRRRAARRRRARRWAAAPSRAGSCDTWHASVTYTRSTRPKSAQPSLSSHTPRSTEPRPSLQNHRCNGVRTGPTSCRTSLHVCAAVSSPSMAMRHGAPPAPSPPAQRSLCVCF